MTIRMLLALVTMGFAAALGAGCASEAPPASPPEEPEAAPETAPEDETAPDEPIAEEPGEAPAEEPAEEPAEAVPADPNKVPLKLELPKPKFSGTPKNIKFGEHREKPHAKPRGPILVPKGATTNVALGKPVTSSDPMPIIGELGFVTDGDKEGTEGSYVELGPGLQWVQIDLGQPVQMHAIVLWHYHAEGRVYFDVVAQAADDPDFISNVRTLYDNDYDNSAGLGVGEDKEYLEMYEGRYIPVDGVTARYLRFYSAGNTSNDMNHYVEVEVYGTPAP